MLEISLFGRFQIHCGEQGASIVFDNRKLIEMFSYLLLHRHQPCSREKLSDMLWPDKSTSQAKKNLRHALWQLQSILDTEHNIDATHILLVESEWVQINPAADIVFDVATLEQAFALTRDKPGSSLDHQSVSILHNAVELYHGDLLEGWYLDWCLFERERLQQVYLSLLDKLIDYCEAHQRFEDGILYGTQILRYDQAREHTHRQLMRLQYLSGNRTAALRQFERCKATLENELGVSPGQQTRNLYEQICTDCFNDVAPLPQKVIGLSEPTPVLSDQMLTNLRHLHQTICRLQDQVNYEIQALEQALENHN